MAQRSLTLTALAGLPHIAPGDDLGAILAAGLAAEGIAPRDGDVLVVAQKVVSKAEGRIVDLSDITPSERARALAAEVNKDARLVEVILSESELVLRTKRDVLIVVHRLGFVMANAGVDQSNVAPSEEGERVLLLPRDPDASAAGLKRQLDAAFASDIGIVINDSFGRAWRNGTVGVALGAAGLPSLESLIGAPDMFGRTLRVTEVALADEIASAASLLMGQADEGQPAVHMRGLSLVSPARPASALIRPKHMDLFR